MKLYWYYFDGRYYFESYCGHDWSYDPIANLVYEDYLTYESTREIRYLTEEIPPLFRPAFILEETMNDVCWHDEVGDLQLILVEVC